MDVLVDIVSDYQLVGIQEVVQSPNDLCGPGTGSAVCSLMSKLNLLIGSATGRYKHAIGDRVPVDSRSQEQYLYVYDSMVLELLETHNYHDDTGAFKRDPFVARFRVIGPPGSSLAAEGFDFAVAQLHTPPSEATEEIHALPDLIHWIEDNVDGDVIVMGDLNADGSYFKEKTQWSVVMDAISESYRQEIPNSYDTTVAVSDNTYDRIITSIPFEDFIDLADVNAEGCKKFYINEEFCPPTSATEAELKLAAAKEVSDHYPVEMCLSCGNLDP
eukprot:gene650-1082_t